ncbi:uncharacterized protein LOC144908846 [Branchiostoma floridae x Branchiostoma belcheri]
MKFQTYPGRNLHGPAAPKPAGLTQHTPAKKSTRGSRTHEERRNDSGHCAMGSSVVLRLTEGGNQDGEEEEDETEDQGSCLVEVHSVRVPEYHSSSSKPLAATRDRPTSTQNISSQCKVAENPPIKKTTGQQPGNKNKLSTTCQVGQKGTKTGKTSSTSRSCKTTTSAPVKRRVGPESFRNADQGLKGKKKTSQSKEDCSSRSGTDSESSSQKIVPTGPKRKLGVASKNTDQGLKKKVKKTRTQTTGRQDCRGRSATDSSLSTQVQKKTQLVPASVSYQKTAATTVKKKTGQGQKRRMKKTTSPNTEGYSSSTCSTSGKDSLQHNSPLVSSTLAPSLNRPSGNMETKLMNFIREAQGMLVMTGDDVAKALGSKPNETHRLLLHMQRTGRVRRVCDKPTRWMMLGQGKGGPARKRKVEATTTTQQKELPSLTTAQQREPPPQTEHQLSSTQAYRSLFIDGSPTRRRQEKATTTTQQKEPTKHQVPSTQTYRSLSTDGSTEEGTSKTSSSTRNLSECGQVYGMRFETQTSLCEEEEEGSEEIVSTSNEVCAQFGKDLFTTEEEEDLEDVSYVSQEEDSGFLEDVTFYTERKKPSPRVQQASSLPSKKQNKTNNQQSLVTTATRRLLSPCGKYVRKTPVKKQVLTDKQSVRISTENGIFCSKPTVAKPTSLEGMQSQMSNNTGVSSTSWQGKKGLSNFRIPKKSPHPGKQLENSQLTVCQKSGDFCGGKRMKLAPSELDNNLLDSSKDSTGKNTQKDISTIKTPPHILKHSVSYFASTTKKPNTKPKLPRPSTTTKDIPKPQEKRETSFVRAKDNGVSLKEPLADIDVMVDVTVDKSAQIQNHLHSCGTCDSNKDLQHSPLSVLRRTSIKTSPSGPPKLYPHRATESISKQCMVGTLGSCDSPPILVHQEEELRSLGTEIPSSLRAARRNLNPCFSLEENFLSSQDTGTDPRRAHGRGVYAEIKDTSRVTGGEVIGQAGHGSWHSTFTSLHEQQCGKGLSCSQGQIRNNRQANFTSLEPKTSVAKATNAGVASFIDTKQHRMTSIDGRAHHMGPVLGAEGLVHHPLGYHRTDHTCSVHQMDSSGQGGDRRHLGRQQKSEKLHQALVTSPLIPEGLCISEKREQNESTRWQRPRSPKSFWIDYWSKAESKDTKSDDMKDRNAEDITVLNDSYSRLVAYSNNAENTNCKEEDTRSCNVKEKMLENTTVVSDRCSGLVAYSPTGTENTDSNKEPSSDLMKNCSRSKVCAKELKTDEKSLTVLKQECKIFRTTETQTSQGFAHTSKVQGGKIANLRQDSQIQDWFDNVDVKFSLEEKVGSSAVNSLTGPVEQSTWTQPKALYTTEERRPQEQKGPQSQEPRGQEAAVDEVRGHDGSEVQEPRGQEQAAVVKARGHDGSEFESRGLEPAVDGARSHDRSEFEPRGQREAAGVNARGHDGSEVSQVSRPQVTVAMVTPQGSRPVVVAAQPSGPPLHPAAAQPVPVSQQSHPIVQLNELCQRNHLPMCFQDISVTGPSHRPRVQIAAVVGDCTFQAEASSKKAARRQAAREALQALYREGYK